MLLMHRLRHPDFIKQDVSKLYKDLLPHVKITLVEAGPALLGPFDAALQDYTHGLFQRRDIDVRLATAVTGVENVEKEGFHFPSRQVRVRTAKEQDEPLKRSDASETNDFFIPTSIQLLPRLYSRTVPRWNSAQWFGVQELHRRISHKAYKKSWPSIQGPNESWLTTISVSRATRGRSGLVEMRQSTKKVHPYPSWLKRLANKECTLQRYSVAARERLRKNSDSSVSEVWPMSAT
jgi:hypothetical protein